MVTTTTLALQCRCGSVRGVAAVSPSTGNHAVCYCDDCQAFAHFLGRANDVLDANGGTDIFQMSPAGLKLTAGVERVACIRLSSKGLLRWYASCCNTPIGNTMASSGVPFIGLIRAFAREPAGAALGPIRARAFPHRAKGDQAAIPKDGSPAFVMILRIIGSILRWRLRGDHRRSPLFDATTGQPLATPRVLRDSERAELRQRCATWRAP